MEAPLPAIPTDELRPHFEDEMVQATLLHLLRLGKHVDPFSNWMLAGATAALIYLLDRAGTQSGAFDRGWFLVLALLLVLSVAAGFFARLMSLQGLVVAHQSENLPWEIARLRKEYRAITGVPSGSLDGRRVIRDVRTMLRSSRAPSEYLGWISKLANRTVDLLTGAEPLDLSKVNSQWHRLAQAAHGVERVLPLVIAQTFFLVLAILCALVGLVWHVL